MRIVVTGGAGFVGSHLVDKLLEMDNEVFVIDNLITGSEENLTEQKNLTIINADVSKPIDIDWNIDWVMHFASPASPDDFEKLPMQILKVGSYGTYNTLNLALEKQAKYFFASTSEVYGDPLEHPQKETYFGNVDTMSPRAVYDESKRFSEAVVMAYHRFHSLDSRIVRIFNTYGPRMRAEDGRVVSNFITQALSGKPLTIYGDGSQTRSFQYVSDLVDGIIKQMNVDYNEPINIGNPNEFTVLELAKKVKKVVGVDNPLEFKPLPKADPKQRKPDISLAKEILNWKPKVELEEGLPKMVEFYSKQLATLRGEK